jgi:hypothetical protein
MQQLPALARFVTPPSYPRRFDTVFFVGIAAQGCDAAELWMKQQQQQQQQQRGPEIVGVKWMGAAEALASGLQLMPPQWLLLQQLAQFPTMADVLRSCSHDLPLHRTIMPVVIKEKRDDGVKTYVLPGDMDHPVFPGESGAFSRWFDCRSSNCSLNSSTVTVAQVLLPVAIIQRPEDAALELRVGAASRCSRS